jgi:hypothetical protein
MDLPLKHGENATWRIASLEPVGKWVREKIVLRAFLYAFWALSKFS